MADLMLDVLIPEFTEDIVLKTTTDTLIKAAEQGTPAIADWIQRLGLAQACHCCRYLRLALWNQQDKHVCKLGRLPTSAEQETEQMKEYRNVKRQVRCVAAIMIQANARGFWSRCGKRFEGGTVVPAPKPGRPRSLSALMEEVRIERDLAGDSFPGMTATADELRREKWRLKVALRRFSAGAETHPNPNPNPHPAGGCRPSAMDLEWARPVFKLYQAVSVRIKELESAGAGAEIITQGETDARKAANLRTEALALQERLKRYEEAFVGAHGRGLKTKGDVAPVALEYARFREVKRLLHELGNV